METLLYWQENSCPPSFSSLLLELLIKWTLECLYLLLVSLNFHFSVFLVGMFKLLAYQFSILRELSIWFFKSLILFSVTSIPLFCPLIFMIFLLLRTLSCFQHLLFHGSLLLLQGRWRHSPVNINGRKVSRC